MRISVFLGALLFFVIAFSSGLFAGYFVFFSKEDASKCPEYIYGIPPAPPFKKLELFLREPYDDFTCSNDTTMIGYVIELIHGKDWASQDCLIIQDTDGVRDNYYFYMSDLPTAYNDLPRYIMIPGTKVKFKKQACGTGNISGLLEIETLQRN